MFCAQCVLRKRRGGRECSFGVPLAWRREREGSVEEREFRGGEREFFFPPRRFFQSLCIRRREKPSLQRSLSFSVSCSLQRPSTRSPSQELSPPGASHAPGEREREAKKNKKKKTFFLKSIDSKKSENFALSPPFFPPKRFIDGPRTERRRRLPRPGSRRGEEEGGTMAGVAVARGERRGGKRG